MLDYLEIRKSHAAGESMNSIALRPGHCQKTVSKVIASQTGHPGGYRRTKPVGYPKLGEFIAIIDQILKDDESAPRKQRHHAKRIYERLKAEHTYAGSYYPVRRYVAAFRQSNRETFMRIDHLPGRRMEFDFGQVQVDYPGGRRTTDVLERRVDVQQLSLPDGAAQPAHRIHPGGDEVGLRVFRLRSA